MSWADWLNGRGPDVAPSLLGAVLTSRTDQGRVAVALTEVEAYDGPDDPASHAWRGPTPRNAVMFGPPGRLYVYFSYGMHWCANVVTGPDGTASAVLLRAGRVVHGHGLARQRRGPRVGDPALARGPACLTRALAIGREHDGIDLGSGGELSIEPGARPLGVSVGPRVGVSRAPDVAWRFWVTGDETVSAYRRSPRA
ncbi:MAG: 3-methyladenine glycosylase [Nocardioidaceae bacterium]|nr:3-methyladenine glycosylase [Nocardioidaceae bacterium]